MALDQTYFHRRLQISSDRFVMHSEKAGDVAIFHRPSFEEEGTGGGIDYEQLKIRAEGPTFGKSPFVN